LFAGVDVFDPDALASEDDPSPVSAGRRAIASVERAMNARIPLVVETTLAGARGVRLLAAARRLGYRVALFFICVESPEMSLRRIAARIAAGGQSVPEADVRRRYVRSLERLPEAIRFATQFTLLDNSDEEGPHTIAHGFEGRVLHRRADLPAWARALPFLDEHRGETIG
jgi:predicted ABC-type ATPase